MTRRKRLMALLDDLEKLHGPAPKRYLKDPLHIALWENVAYLADDEKRQAAFDRLNKATALDPERIAEADFEVLAAICCAGGPHGDDRAERLRRIAELALEEGDGDLAKVLRRPLKEARRVLKRLPAIGDPGVDRILLFSGTAPLMSLESNGLRVLLRIGYGKEGRSYAASYRSACEAAAEELPEEAAPRIRAWHLLRKHGQVTCRRTRPACPVCPLSPRCAFVSRS